jgi:magnesium-transporting ATPase (P-type)
MITTPALLLLLLLAFTSVASLAGAVFNFRRDASAVFWFSVLSLMAGVIPLALFVVGAISLLFR